MPQSLCLQNMGNDYMLKGFDAQIKTNMEVQLLSVTSWLSSSAWYLHIHNDTNCAKYLNKNEVENIFLAQGCKSIAV